MQKVLLIKILVILALTLAICVPLSMIESTVRERSAFREQAVASIAADSVREQTIVGPLLVLPYAEEYEEQVAVANDPARKFEMVRRVVQRRKLVFPNELRVNSAIETDHRYRGIHKVLVYSGQHAFGGDFDLPLKADLARTEPGSRISFGRPFIALSVDDVRGIRNIPKVSLGGQVAEFEQGSGLASHPGGLHASVEPFELAAPARVKFSFELGLDGIERQHFAPVAKNNKFAIRSNWAHPQFGGRFLPSPKDRVIDANGFSATWSISALATGAQQQIAHAENPGAREPGSAPPELDRFGVGFIEPVNVYSLADRATKYGLLFVALTFAAFFVFEILKRLPIHPVQYLLVGLALALFCLLLVGLSEHIAFLPAYLAASAACIGLIGFYLSHVLHDRRRGLGFGCALTLLYGCLYGLLISENNALVLGSLLLFAVLAAVMVATRKVDWYQVGSAERAL